METQAASVRIRGLYKSFGDKEVLSNIDTFIKPGAIYVLMGPSGSGKSVLLKHIIGLLVPDKGSVLINSINANEAEAHEKTRTAFVFQAGALFNSMTLFDNLAFYPREHELEDETAIRSKIEHLLETLGLQDAVHAYPSELSGGMRKRASIARALIMEPQLLLYDEPTSELDPVRSAQISSIICKLRKQFEVTSIVVSHDRDLALTIADKVALIQDGSILVETTPDQLRKSTDPIVQSFLNPKIEV